MYALGVRKHRLHQNGQLGASQGAPLIGRLLRYFSALVLLSILAQVVILESHDHISREEQNLARCHGFIQDLVVHSNLLW